VFLQGKAEKVEGFPLKGLQREPLIPKAGIELYSTPASPGKQWKKLQDYGSWKQEPETEP